MKKIQLLFITLINLCVNGAFAQTIVGSNYGGADFTVPNGAILNGTFSNIGTFRINAGTTVFVTAGSPLSIQANNIIIDGSLNGTGCGYAGGPTNNVGNASGLPGSGSGGGQGGLFGPCVHSDGGAGGGYGGNGGNSGSAFGNNPPPVMGGSVYGTINTFNSLMGSGGGAGGNYCTGNGFGGQGGAGGAAIYFQSNTITVSSTGAIIADGQNGFPGTSSFGQYASGGGGSGGTIEINCASGVIEGVLRANGGNGYGLSTQHYAGGGGGGGGGRIKIANGVFTLPASTVTVNGGVAGLSYGTILPQNGQLGTIYGVVICSPGGGLNFDGVNDYVQISNAPVLSNTFTQEAWVYSTSIADGAYHGVWGYEPIPGAFPLRAPSLYIYNGTQIHFGFGNGITWNSFISAPGTIAINTWTHIAVTFDGTDYKLYINGTNVFSSNLYAGKIPYSTGVANIGRVDNYFKGNLDEVRFWNRALTEAEIQHNRNCELMLPQTGLMAYYKFNQGFSTCDNTGLSSLDDGSENNRNGTLFNFALIGTQSNWVTGNVTGNCTPFDLTPPDLTCPENITVSTTSGQCSAIVNFAAIANDPSGVASITYSQNSGTSFPKGTTIVNVTATDNLGNSTDCSFNVTIEDMEDPTFNCPSNQNVNLNASCQLVVPDLIAGLTGSDNCGTVTFSQNPLSNVVLSSSHNQTHNVLITASDGNGNTQTCTVVLTGKDVTKPTFTCPNNQNVDLNNSCQVIVPDLIAELTGNDNCGTVTFAQSPSAETLLGSTHNQTHNVVITASDGNGNTLTCTVILTGKDVSTPTFTCPSNQNINLNGTCQLIVPNLIAGLTGNDNCGTVTFTQSPVTGASLPSSHNQTHNILITANDGNGNTTQCTVVLTGKDITPPVINCVENITKANDLGICGAIVNYTSPANSDNCGCVAPTSISGYTLLGTYNGHKYFRSTAFATWTYAKNIANGLGGHLATVNSSGEQLFLQGATTELAWIGFTDEANEGTFVWVTGEPANYTNWLLPSEPNNYGGNENYAVFNGHGTYWNDLAGNNSLQYIVEFECETNTGGVIVTQTGGLPSGSTFPVGITTNTFMATDAAGNTSTCSFTVTINDTEKPTVTKGTISSCYSSLAEAEAAALEATSYSDNCSSFEELVVNVSTEGTCSAVITVTVTDAANNSRSVSYDTKIDNISPVLSLTPANVIVNCQSVPPVPTVTANDNCDGGVNVTFTPTSTQGSDPAQSNYYNYTITRKWYATDGCGNTVEHMQTITVQDVTKPVITCPADKLSVPFDFGQTYATIAIGTATASDNCADPSNITIGGTRSDNVAIANQQYPLGQTTVAWTAADPSGNSDGCTQTVTVRKRNTSVTYTGAMRDDKIVVQYSDIIYLQAKLTDNEGLVTPNNISGRTITFQLLSGTTVLRSKTATTNASGVAMDTFKIEQAPGMYSVKTIFAGDSYFNGSNDQDNCEVKKEDAIVEYNGSQYFTTASSTTLTGSITVAASLNDIDDGSDKRGDIRKAKATFRDGGPAGTVLGSANLPVGLVNPGILTNGLSATTHNNITLNSNEASSGGKIYQVWVGASDHYTGADAGPTPVTLALPGQDFVTGGGHLVVTNSAGTYAGTLNSKMNFGFTMKWNKSGKNLQGNINIVFRKWQLYNGVWQWRVYQAKSNAINSMAVVEVGANGQPVSGTNPAAFRKAIINTKANLKDVTDPLANIDLGGNHNLTLDAWDHITGNGGVSDKISVTLMGATTNELLFSSSWSSNATQAQTITGGNINVRNSSGGGATIRSETTKNAQMESSPIEVKDEFNVKAYPNPSQHQFALVINSNLNEAIQIKVYDALGRKIQTISAKANETIQFGEKLKAGIYIAEVTQGKKRETVKLIKQ